MANWTFITNHGLVLATIAKNPEMTAREISDEVGITERTTHKIIMDLDKEGYLSKTRVGVKNAYTINPDLQMKTGDASVGELLVMLGWKRRKRQTKTDTTENSD